MKTVVTVVAPKYGQSLSSGEVCDWITAALDLRISPRGNDGPEAVESVIEIVRAYAEERAANIVIERRQETVEAECRGDADRHDRTKQKDRTADLIKKIVGVTRMGVW